MKVLSILSTLLAIAVSYPSAKTWTYYQLSDIVWNRKFTAMLPFLRPALLQMTEAFGRNEDTDKFIVMIPSPSGKPLWTVEELTKALQEDKWYEFTPDIRAAIELYKQKVKDGKLKPGDSVPLMSRAVDVSLWNMRDLNEALRDTSTNVELIPYLEKARKELETSPGGRGLTKEFIGVVTPVGLFPHSQRIPMVAGYFVEKALMEEQAQ